MDVKSQKSSYDAFWPSTGQLTSSMVGISITYRTGSSLVIRWQLRRYPMMMADKSRTDYNRPSPISQLTQELVQKHSVPWFNEWFCKALIYVKHLLLTSHLIQYSCCPNPPPLPSPLRAEVTLAHLQVLLIEQKRKGILLIQSLNIHTLLPSPHLMGIKV